MRERTMTNQDADEGVYEFVCVPCGTVKTLRLTSAGQVPDCRCGAPLSPITLLADSPTDPDMCGENFLNELCEEPRSLDLRSEGLSHVNGPAGHPSETIHEMPEFAPLDHPHVEPDCQFCAARQQRPSQHRLWCAVFFLRQCSCGFEP